MATKPRSSLPGRLVTVIGLSFFSVEIAVLAVFTPFYWGELKAERQRALETYARGVHERARVAVERLGQGRVDSPPNFRDLPEIPADTWVFLVADKTGDSKLPARRFEPHGRQLYQPVAWPADGGLPPIVEQLLTEQQLTWVESDSAGRLAMAQPIPSGGSDASILGVVYVETDLRDIQREVAKYAGLAFLAGAAALFVSALITIGFLRRALLIPLSKMIQADNAARRGDEQAAVIDMGDIPEDEVGAIMRSRNRLFLAMTQAHKDLDRKNATLEEQRHELREWGTKLEQLVEDKTSALLRARDRLHRNEKLAALGKLAANVAHEINNPLASIAGYAEAARDELTGDEAQAELASALRVIEEQAFRCKEILKRLLGLARADPVEKIELDLGALVRETAALAEPGANKLGVELELELPAEGPTVSSDPGALQQVVLNLIDNAVDAASKNEQGGRVSVGLEARAEGVILSVADDGQGIPPDLQGRVFDPFYTTKPVGRGTGLGLAICHSLLEQLGGSIQLESAPGSGARFTVRLPQATRNGNNGRAGSPLTVDHSHLVEASLGQEPAAEGELP